MNMFVPGMIVMHVVPGVVTVTFFEAVLLPMKFVTVSEIV